MSKTTYLEGKALYERARYNDIRELLKTRVDKTPEKAAYRYRVGKERRTETKTYGDFWREINAVGEAALARGLCDISRVPEGKFYRLNDALGVVGSNTYGWMLMYAAYLFGLGVAVPIDKDLKPDEAAGIANRAELKMLAYTKSHRKLAEKLAENCPTLHSLIALQPEDEAEYLEFGERKVTVIRIKDLIEEGEKLMAEGSRRYQDLPIHSHDIAAIFFTSGTTARSKGVMLSHWNITSCIYCGFSIIEPWGKDSALSVLPLHHTYENTVGQIALWQLGVTLCFNDSLRHVMENLREWDIEILYMVPLILEMMHRRLLQAIEKQGKLKLFNFMMKLSKGLRKIKIDLRRPLFKKIREGMGPNLKSLMVGGAPIDPELMQFFWDLGFDTWNAYGLTECAPGLAAGNEKTITADSVGIPIAESKMRITPDSFNNKGEEVGELQVICDNVMLGYFRDPENTAKAFTEDGWFRTGDYGYFRGNNIHLTGRESSMIVLENGQNIFPEELESLMRGIPNVIDAMIWAEHNQRNQTEIYARLEVDESAVAKLGEEESKTLGEQLSAALKAINEKLPKYKNIRYFLWSFEPMIRTTSRKVKRRDEIAKVSRFLDGIGKTMREASGMEMPASETAAEA